MKRVRFLRAHRIWNAGEIAAFPAEEASRLARLGVAVDPVAELAAGKAEARKATAEQEAAAKAQAEQESAGKARAGKGAPDKGAKD